jgi:hypothetical protein
MCGLDLSGSEQELVVPPAEDGNELLGFLEC